MVNLDFSKYSPQEIIYQFNETGKPEWVKPYFNFLNEFVKEDTFKVQTSGTTGKKKNVTILKKQLFFSAKGTLKFFNLTEGDTVLLPLSCHFIAGKMMLVRAIIGKLNLFIIEPSGDPSEYLDRAIDFCPAVPMQVENIIQSGAISNIKTLLIGGGNVPDLLADKLQKLKINAFESFAMTETLTHFALRKVSPIAENFFTTLAGFKIDTTECNELIILENELTKTALKTHDIIEKHSETTFKWLGRSDNIINSGGIIFIPEEIELKIIQHIHKPFVLVGVKNEKFGEIIVLVHEGEGSVDLNQINDSLSKFERIKLQFCLQEFPRTENGKIKRNEIKSLIDA